MRRLLLIIAVCLPLLLLSSVNADAQTEHIVLVQSRPGVVVPFYYIRTDNAKATIVLLPGGSGNIDLEDGTPESEDFLVRSRDYFAANGFNVAVIDHPSDKKRLDLAFRTSQDHLDDLRNIVDYLRQDADLPIWLVGTSRGTISATAAAAALGADKLAGIVLTSSITAPSVQGAVPSQKLDAIQVPVLIVHHRKDMCQICNPNDVPLIMKGLVRAPVKKAVLISGGSDPEGSTCSASHSHGYIGKEKETVDIVTQWIDAPTS